MATNSHLLSPRHLTRKREAEKRTEEQQGLCSKILVGVKENLAKVRASTSNLASSKHASPSMAQPTLVRISPPGIAST